MNMKHYKLQFLLIILLFLGSTINAQNLINQNAEYSTAIDLYQTENYIAAEKMFDDLIASAESSDPIIYDYQYYRLLCGISRNSKDIYLELNDYLNAHPETPRKNSLMKQLGFLQVRNKQFKPAVATLKKVDASKLNATEIAEYNFKLGYALLNSKSNDAAKMLFESIMQTTSEYQSDAQYYYGYINYLEGNYDEALAAFSKVKGNTNYSDVLPYYLLQINYLKENYNDVVSEGPAIIAAASDDQVNELNKILGDSYYELKEYSKAIPYLEAFKGVRGKKTIEDYYRLGYCYYKSKAYEKAIPAFEKATFQENELAQNAFYHLADCYLNLDDKNKARVAFERASKLSFVPEIEEDALFNFAKLTYELSYSPFNETIKAFDAYIAKYQNSPRNSDAIEYLVEVYMTTRNYEDAINSINNIQNKTPKLLEALQRVTYFQGLVLFKGSRYNAAIEMFNESLKNQQQNKIYAALAVFWKAAANLRLTNYELANQGFQQFQSMKGIYALDEYGLSFYNLGYSNFYAKNYVQAQKWFNNYVNQRNTEPEKVADAYNRMGDCWYLQRDYTKSKANYTKAYQLGTYDPDYALFQRATVNGINKNYEAKINDLQAILNSFGHSSFIDDALFEIAKAHESLNQIDQAISDYLYLTKEVPNSSYVKKAFLQLGLIFYNRSNYVDSNDYYKKVIEKYPNTEEARAALVGVKNNYIELNDVDAYFSYTQNLGNTVNVTVTEQDSIYYMAAERNYMSGGDDVKAKFEEYLKRFPDGNFRVNAMFYLAEVDYADGKYSEALKLYEEVAKQTDNIFTEATLLKAGELCYTAKEFEQSIKYYTRLEAIANTQWNLLKARVGILRNSYQLKMYNEAIQAAVVLLNTEKVSDVLVREANYLIAKSNYELGNLNEATKYFKLLTEDMNSVEGAEAKFMLAKILYEQSKYAESEQEVMNFIENPSPHQYWLAKAFILLSDVYEAQNDLFQAKHTLNSIIENYGIQDDGILEEAKVKVKALEAKERETILDNSAN